MVRVVVMVMVMVMIMIMVMVVVMVLVVWRLHCGSFYARNKKIIVDPLLFSDYHYYFVVLVVILVLGALNSLFIGVYCCYLCCSFSGCCYCYHLFISFMMIHDLFFPP